MPKPRGSVLGTALGVATTAADGNRSETKRARPGHQRCGVIIIILSLQGPDSSFGRSIALGTGGWGSRGRGGTGGPPHPRVTWRRVEGAPQHLAVTRLSSSCRSSCFGVVLSITMYCKTLLPSFRRIYLPSIGALPRVRVPPAPATRRASLSPNLFGTSASDVVLSGLLFLRVPL